MQTLKYVIGKDYRPLTMLEAKSSNVSNIDYGANPNWVQARQYEDGLRQVFVEITNEDGSPYDLTGANVLFEGILPDNEHKILDNSHAVFYEDPTSGKFRFDLPAAAFAVAGQYKQAFFRITKGYQNVATLEFKLEVLADMVVSGLVPRDYISPLVDFLSEIKAVEAKTLAELKDTQNKTLDDIKSNGDKALATLQDLEIQNVATLKKIVDDKVNEINNLMAITNSSNQSVLGELTNAKSLLVDLQTKIKEDGLFTKYDADKMVEGFQAKTQELTQRVSDAVAQANTLVENKIAKLDNGVHGYPNADAIKKAYPNGAQGIFVAVDTGHQWYYVNDQWTDGGAYQATSIQPEISEARAWPKFFGANKTYPSLEVAMAAIVNRLNLALDEEKENRVAIEKNLTTLIEALPRTNLAKREIDNIVDGKGNPIEWLVDDYYTFDFDRVFENSKQKNDYQLMTPRKIREWGGLPVVKLNNVPSGITDVWNTEKISAKDVLFSMPDKGVYETLKQIKIQGSSSVNFPKKNYTIKFDNPVEIRSDWGKHKKYVLKSNFNDASQTRNVVASKIWKNMVKTRLADNLDEIVVGDNILSDNAGNSLVGVTDPLMSIGKNYGAIDGFPVVVMINDKFHGLYTLNIPKDDWMANMGQGQSEAIFSADYGASNASYFNGTPNFDGDFEIEYITDEDDDAWAKSSLAQAIAATRASYNSDEEYYDEISKYIDVESAIDYMILNTLTGDSDGNGKNYLLDTFDGKKWYFVPYDKDSIFGNYFWAGNKLDTGGSSTFARYASEHRMFNVIYTHMTQKLVSRWKTLRTSALSFGNLYLEVMNFYGSIPQVAFDKNNEKWPTTPMSSIKNADQIIFWIKNHLELLDDEINKLEEQTNG